MIEGVLIEGVLIEGVLIEDESPRIAKIRGLVVGAASARPLGRGWDHIPVTPVISVRDAVNVSAAE